MSRTAITVPKIGLTAEEVTIERWIKSVGDTVTRGEAVAEMETDKAVVELESPADGVLAEIVVDTNGTAAIGAVVAYIEGSDSD